MRRLCRCGGSRQRHGPVLLNLEHRQAPFAELHEMSIILSLESIPMCRTGTPFRREPSFSTRSLHRRASVRPRCQGPLGCQARERT